MYINTHCQIMIFVSFASPTSAFFFSSNLMKMFDKYGES